MNVTTGKHRLKFSTRSTASLASGLMLQPLRVMRYRLRREKYLKEARDYLDEDATNEEIDEEIENELEAWND